MQSHRYLLTAAATGLVLTGLGLSQGDSKGTQDPSTRPNQQGQDQAFRAEQWVDMDDLIGTDVQLEASREEKREASEDGERAEGETGELSDVLFDCKDGSVQWGVVSCGGWLGMGEKNVLLPVHALTWSASEECFYLGLSEEQIKALPSFDLEDARERGLDDTITAYEMTWKERGLAGKPVEASGPANAEREKREKRANAGARSYGDTSFTPLTWRFVSASELDGLDVYAQDTDVADISTFIVDHDAHRIAFVVLSHGGIGDLGDTKYIVPFEALQICHMGDADDDDPTTVFSSPMTEDQIETCVEYEEPEEGALSQATLAQLRAKQGARDAAGGGR